MRGFDNESVGETCEVRRDPCVPWELQESECQLENLQAADECKLNRQRRWQLRTRKRVNECAARESSGLVTQFAPSA